MGSLLLVALRGEPRLALLKQRSAKRGETKNLSRARARRAAGTPDSRIGEPFNASLLHTLAVLFIPDLFVSGPFLLPDLIISTLAKFGKIKSRKIRTVKVVESLSS